MLASKTIVGHPKIRAHVSLWQPPWPKTGLGVVGAFLDGTVAVYAVIAGNVVLFGVLELEEFAAFSPLAGKIAAEQVIADEVVVDYESPLDGDLYVNGEKV